ncbi:MAG: EpsG family protein [Clostridia bacterium]|nr:EpsG family protein [Clostridia bacterium]
MSLDFSGYQIVLAFCLIFNILLIKYSKNFKLSLIFSVLSLSILAFCFNPIRAWKENGNYTDLCRFFYDLDIIKKNPNFSNEKLLTNYDVIPIVKILIYLVAKLKVNNFLPFIVSALYYGIFFSVLLHLKNNVKINLNTLRKAGILFLLLSNFQMLITNIRVPLGCSICTLIFYYDFIKKIKFKKILFMYILLLGIHPYFIIILMLRILFYILNKINNKILKGIIYSIIVMYGLFISMITNILSDFSSNTYIKFILSKMDFYTNGSADQYIDYNSAIVVFSKIISILILIYYINKNIKNDKIDKRYLDMINFSKIMAVFAIGSLANMTIFSRTGILLTGILLYLYIILNNMLSNKKSNQFIIYIPNAIVYFMTFMQVVLLFLGYQYQILCF